MKTKTPEALEMLDTMARGCALWADQCTGDIKKGWELELTKFDKAHAAFAKLIDAAKELSRQHKNVRAAEGYSTPNSLASDAVDAALAAVEKLP